MDVSKFISRVLGTYFIILSTLLMWEHERVTALFSAMMANGPLVFFIGIFTIMIGVVLVTSHNIWRNDFRLLITLIAWITLIKGISIITFSKEMTDLTVMFTTNMYFFYGSLLVDLFLGVLLFWYGYKK